MNNASTPQSPVGQPQPAVAKRSGEVGLSIQVVLLIIMGLFFVLIGLVSIGVFLGALPYSENSTIALLLVLIALYSLTTGESPFGEPRVTWSTVTISLVLGVIGVLGVFFPGGAVSLLVGILVFFVFVIGGIAELVRLFTSEKRAKAWMKIGGVLRQLTIAAGIVYALEIITGVGGLFFVIKTNPLWLLVIVIFGISFFYLAWCIQKVNRQYRPELTKTPG